MERRLFIESTSKITDKPKITTSWGKRNTVQGRYSPNNVPRGSWKIGKIIEFFPNSEGKVRAAKVLLGTKSTVNRPLNMRYYVECESIVNDTAEKIKQWSKSNTQSQEKMTNQLKNPHFRNQQDNRLKKPPLINETRYLDIIYKRNLIESSLWDFRERLRT